MLHLRMRSCQRGGRKGELLGEELRGRIPFLSLFHKLIFEFLPSERSIDGSPFK
jgi:hypothetical protein